MPNKPPFPFKPSGVPRIETPVVNRIKIEVNALGAATLTTDKPMQANEVLFYLSQALASLTTQVMQASRGIIGANKPMIENTDKEQYPAGENDTEKVPDNAS